MTELTITWPDESAEQVRAAIGRLTQAGPQLRARSLEQRLALVRDVLASWTAPDSAWRRELATTLPEASGFSPGTVRHSLDAALIAWDPDRLVACARRELGLGDEASPRRLAPYDWTLVWAGGSIPMPTLLTSLLPLVLGSPVLLRETRKDPVTARLVKRSIRERDEELARCFEAVCFSPDDESASKVALAAPCVVATGSDETLGEISAHLAPKQRFVGYGHRFSIAVLGPDLKPPTDHQERAPRDSLRDVAAGLAIDVARWDQAGCLSPVVVYLVGWPNTWAEELAEETSSALDRLAEEMPRGARSEETRASQATERAEARMRSALGPTVVHEGQDHTVVLESDAAPRPAPLSRFLRVMPVRDWADLEVALAPFDGHLSTAAVAGFAGEEPAKRLASLGLSRTAPPGRLQTPPVDWPRDGQPLFTPMARFVGAGET